MANPLFQSQQARTRPYQQEDMQKLYGQFQQDPSAFLTRAGLNIPASFSGDARALVQHLAQTGQVPKILQGRVNAMLNGR